MRLAKTSSISAKFEILTCKNFSFHGNLNDRKKYGGKIFKILWKKLQELKEITKIWKQQRMYKDLGYCFDVGTWSSRRIKYISKNGSLAEEIDHVYSSLAR